MYVILTLPSTVHQEEKILIKGGLNRELGRCSVDEIRARIEGHVQIRVTSAVLLCVI